MPSTLTACVLIQTFTGRAACSSTRTRIATFETARCAQRRLLACWLECSALSFQPVQQQTTLLEPTSRTDFKTPVLRLRDAVVEARRAAKQKRTDAWAGKLRALHKQGKLRLMRVHRKTPWSMKVFKGTTTKKQAPSSSTAIHAAVCNTVKRFR